MATKKKVGRPKKTIKEEVPVEKVEIVETKWSKPPVRDNLHGREVILDVVVNTRKYKAHLRNNVSGKALIYVLDSRGTRVCMEFDADALREAVNGLYSN